MHKAIRAVLENQQRLRPFAEAAPPDPAPPAVDPLAELERRFDGPVPVRLREAALAGGAERLAQRRARADVRVYRGLIRDTIACLRALRRSAGPAAREPAGREATLMAQLAWYRERRRQPLRRLLRQPRGSGSAGAHHLGAVDRGGGEA